VLLATATTNAGVRAWSGGCGKNGRRGTGCGEATLRREQKGHSSEHKQNQSQSDWVITWSSCDPEVISRISAKMRGNVVASTPPRSWPLPPLAVAARELRLPDASVLDFLSEDEEPQSGGRPQQQRPVPVHDRSRS